MGAEPLETFQKAIRANFECESKLREAVPVEERFQGATIFEGVVHVFDLIAHPTAKVAYVWHSPGKGVYTVLHEPPVDSAAAAVRAAIMAGAE